MDDVEQAQDLTHPPAHDRECGARLDGDASAFDLEEGKGHGRQDDMVRPALKGAALEVIEAELVFQFAILLFDRPAAAGERISGNSRRWGCAA